LLPAHHLPLPPPPLLPVPPAITLETVQVNEISDIISWQPPAEPNGEILHYNIRIYHVDGNGNQELVDTLREVHGTTFDFSTQKILELTTFRLAIRVSYTTLKYNVV